MPALAAITGVLADVKSFVVIGFPTGRDSPDRDGIDRDSPGRDGIDRDSVGAGPSPAHYLDYADWVDSQPDDDPGYLASPDEVSMQLYTSGTTGLPKGVMLSNRNLAMILSKAAPQTFGIDRSTVSLVAMPLFHIGGSGWALAGMSAGGCSVIMRDMDPAELVGLITTERITHAFLVPAVLMALLAVPGIREADLSSLDTIFYGASPIAEDVLVRCLDVFGCRFGQVYGMTETSGAIVLLGHEDHDPNGSRSQLLRAAGKAVPGVELRIVDPASGATAPPNHIGEVWTRSAYNMVGYWLNADETAAITPGDGWLRTGDAGYLDEAGYLFLHDRMKDMVITGGENVYPAEVENILLAHPCVADAAVIGVPDDKWGEAVKAIMVLRPGSDLDAGEII